MSLSHPSLISLRVGTALVALSPLFAASVAAARSEAMGRLKFLAERDIMTGARNRRAFFEVGAVTLAESVRRARPVAVMMVDLDHFKSINDRYGHATGDRVLKVVARTMESALRSDDVIGRLGGEEFAIVLPDCDIVEAMSVGKRINQALRDTKILLESGDAVTVTASIGINLAVEEQSLEYLLNHADKALYRAKQAGRDRVELASTVLKFTNADRGLRYGLP